MKIDEFRKLAKEANQDAMIAVASLLYRHVSKAKKEELDGEIEALIRSGGQKPAAKRAAPKNEEIDLATLGAEIETFIRYAENDLYIAPNRTVPKAKRSKWRFEVMRFYKQLCAVDPQGPDGRRANELLLRLFNLLSYGCGYYIFNTDDPFTSIQIRQYAFFSELVKRAVSAVLEEKELDALIQAAATNYLDHENLHRFMEHCLVASLPRELLPMALSLTEDGLRKLKPSKSRYDEDYYGYTVPLRELSCTRMMIRLRLGESEAAVMDTFERWKKTERDPEIALYCTLDRLDMCRFDEVEERELTALWLSLFDRGVGEGIEPREILLKKREEKLSALMEEEE